MSGRGAGDSRDTATSMEGQTVRMLAAAFAFGLMLAGAKVLSAQVPPRQGAMGRIDIYVVDEAFELARVKGSPGATVGRCSWLGEGKDLTGVTCEKRLGRDWERIWVEFVPEADGQVDIDLQSEYYERTAPEDVRLVWADDVEVEGAGIANAGFEDVGPDGRPTGWRFTSALPLERYSRDGSVAHQGRSCVAVWYGGQARQAFPVQAGKRYRVSAWFRVMDADRVWTPPSYRFEFPMPTYVQEVRLEFRDPQAARLAQAAIEPLLDGQVWSVSCRWDDNNLSDLKMRDVMTAHGYKGTFYLNGITDWFGGEVGRQLLQDGHSIGGHSMTHPFLSFTNPNRQFREVLTPRVQWEAATDVPINSYSFSFCDFRSGPDGQAAQRNIAAALHRAGYFHIANGWFNDTLDADFELSPILPSDGAPIRDAAEGYLQDDAHRERHPHMSHSMHVWYNTPQKWAVFEDQLDAYGRRPDWWYCNQSEYAAYRWQFRHSAVEEALLRGNALTLRLRRPVLGELNNPVPLTISFKGTKADALTSASCDTADVELVRTPSGLAAVDVAHDRARRLPEAIALVENPHNHSSLSEKDLVAEFPGLAALLHFDGGRLQLELQDRGAGPLQDVTLTYRLPVAWKEGVVRRQIGDVAGRFHDGLSPTRADGDYRLICGPGFCAAQMDFRRDGRPLRLHLSCIVPAPDRDPSFPQGGFSVLGPVPAADFDEGRLAEAVRAGQLERGFAGAARLQWRPESAEARDMLGAEIVATSGEWFNADERPKYYLLRSTVTCPEERQAGLLCEPASVQVAFLNGERIGNAPFRMRKGENDLVVIALVSKDRFSASNAGCFLRLVRPGTDERLADVRYEVRP